MWMQVSWEDGLQQTIDWYRKYSSRYGDLESALVPHPVARTVSEGEL